MENLIGEIRLKWWFLKTLKKNPSYRSKIDQNTLPFLPSPPFGKDPQQGKLNLKHFNLDTLLQLLQRT